MNDGDLWVFGYGSLMWRPDFAYEERVRARLLGAHRRLCIYSHVHRGTPDRPGLVLGLAPGGSCLGVAFRVKAELREPTIAYLRAREQVTSVYVEAERSVAILDGTSRKIRALCYLADRRHAQYAAGVTHADMVHLVRHAKGQSGANPDYVLATIAEMERLGIRDAQLFAIARELGPQDP